MHQALPYSGLDWHTIGKKGIDNTISILELTDTSFTKLLSEELVY